MTIDISEYEDYSYEEIVSKIRSEMDSMSSDEFEILYEMLPKEYQDEVDEAAEEFADNAIGTSIWRLGTDFED